MARKKSQQGDVERLLQPDVARELALAAPGFDRRALLTELIECFGGVKKFARSIYLEYMASPAGSMQKQRWGNLMCVLLSQESQQADQQRPVEQMSEDEIRDSILAFVDKVRPGPGVPPSGEASGG